MTLSPIIIVEDDPSFAESLFTALTRAGYTALTAIDGEDALKQMEYLNTSCLFLVDLMMPKLDGWALLSKIREHGDQNKLTHRAIVISGSANAEDIARQEGVGFLAKPFELAALLSVVKQSVEI